MPKSARQRLHGRDGGALPKSIELTVPMRRVKAASPHATISATLERIQGRNRNASSGAPRKGSAFFSSTKGAVNTLLTDENSQRTNNTRSLRGTTSFVSLKNSRTVDIRGFNKRAMQSGPRRNSKQRVSTGASMAKDCNGGDATLELEVEKDTESVETALKSRNTSDQNENTALFKELGNAIDELQSRDIGAVSSIPPVTVASLQPSVHINPVTQNDKESVDSHTNSSSQRVKSMLNNPGNNPSQSVVKVRHLGTRISDDLELELFSYNKKMEYNTEDLTLIIRTPETAITIWDGRIDEYYTFPCQLFLKCADMEKFCFWSTPDLEKIEISCSSVPVSGRYRPKKLTGLRTSYRGTRVDNPDRIKRIDPKKGIHVEGDWHASKDSDGVWGWRVNVWTPIPISVFDKVESRIFKMMGQVWIGDEPVEKAELTFSVSVLLRNEYMV
ncbi:hypothetical protein V8B97DRAFT_758112 [Scleroderma yunnanense]